MGPSYLGPHDHITRRYFLLLVVGKDGTALLTYVILPLWVDQAISERNTFGCLHLGCKGRERERSGRGLRSLADMRGAKAKIEKDPCQNCRDRHLKCKIPRHPPGTEAAPISTSGVSRHTKRKSNIHVADLTQATTSVPVNNVKDLKRTASGRQTR